MGFNDQFKYRDLFSQCPVCDKVYDEYWKIVNHIRKTKDQPHQIFLEKQEAQFIDVYLSSPRQKLHDNLAIHKNIFAGTSFAHTSKILRNKYTEEELENLRKERISATLSGVAKTPEHNKKVSKAVEQAWKDGKFDTEEIKQARQRGYDQRRSYRGKNNPMYGKPSPRGAGRGKGGIRQDLGHYVRSRWEANVCRICLYYQREYEYEQDRFSVVIDGTDYTYCPDLYFPKKKLYYEIKGHARSSSEWHCTCKTCIKNKKIMPAVIEQYGIRLILVGKYEYMRMRRLFMHQIPNWENER